METTNNNELIDYIFGHLNEDDKRAFERKMELDPELSEEYARQKEIFSHINAAVNLKEVMNDPGYKTAEIQAEEAVRKYEKKKQRTYLLSKKFRRKYIYPFAASFLGLLYLGNLTIFLASPELAFEKYYKDYTPVYYAQATINEAQLLLTHSLDEYSKGNYEAVAENMRTLMEKGELNVRGQIMLAFYDAWKKPLFNNFKTKKTTEEDATWYLALAANKLNDLQTAQDLFSKISSENSLRGWRAARMERKINKTLLAE